MILENLIEKSYPLIRIVGNEKQKTLYFKIGKKEILPGQFFMLNYNVNQKPVSVSGYDGDTIGFTVEARGECTKKMINAVKGEYFGLTGPLGTSFNYKDFKKVLIIGGGIGTAPVYYLANSLDENTKADVLFGARNKDFISYIDGFKNQNINLKIYTDDGSDGIKGFVTKDLDIYLDNNDYDTLFLCGPEIMMKIVLDNVKDKIKNIQVSMERYMKCGIGICGSCVLDMIAKRVCTEGPVFNYDTIKKTVEFGVYKRDKNGIIEKF